MSFMPAPSYLISLINQQATREEVRRCPIVTCYTNKPRRASGLSDALYMYDTGVVFCLAVSGREIRDD